MTLINDSRILRTMARNVHETAIAKQSQEDIYGAAAAFTLALQHAQHAINLAQSDHDQLAAERRHALIQEDLASFNAE